MSRQILSLGEICEIVMGQAPSGDTYNTQNEGFPLIAGAGDFKNGIINVNKFTTAPTKLSAVNDIILSIRASIGDKVWSDSVYCLGRGVAAIRPSPSFDKRFLWHTLTNLEKELFAKGKGATFQQVNKEDISSLKIPLPPLPEQKRIAAILDKADELKRKREAAIAKLDQLAQSIFVEMFGNVIVNDKGWQTFRLGDVGTLDRGISKHRPRNAPELLGGNYPLVQTGEVANCDGYIRNHNSSYSEIGLRQSKMWPAGTLCITIAANIAKTGILTFDACFPDSVVGFRADNAATVEYVRVWLSFLQKMLEESAPESAQKNINLAILRELSIPFPPITLQEEFRNRLKAMQTLNVKFSTALAKQNNLFSSLQHQAFSGQL